jgi:hypothetical protein
MQRRRYLALASASMAALGLAGCSEDGGGENNSSGGEATGASGGQETEAESTETEAATETEMSTEMSGGETTDMPETTMDGDQTEEMTNETMMETETEMSTEMEAETTMSESGGGNESSDGGDDSSSLSDSGDTDVTLEGADIADSLSVESVAWYEEDMSQGVRGEITNTSDGTLSYVEIQALLYDSEGTRLGEALDNVSDLGGGETYAFDAVSLLTGDKADSVASYELNVSDSL